MPGKFEVCTGFDGLLPNTRYTVLECVNDNRNAKHLLQEIIRPISIYYRSQRAAYLQYRITVPGLLSFIPHRQNNPVCHIVQPGYPNQYFHLCATTIPPT